MQYAVLSDIHGDYDGLVAVWSAIKQRGLTDRPIFNAGDNVGYGTCPEEACLFLRDHSQIVNVQGNYDKNVANFPRKEADFRTKWAKNRPDKFNALRSGSRKISEATRLWLLALPQEVSVALEDVKIILTHYTPGSKESLGACTSDQELASQSKRTDADIVICGHTHSAFARRSGGVLFINPGSVGRAPSFGHPYAILTLSEGQLPTAELKQV